MGLGYMGYYYVQHTWQTGVYTTRFVHNDVLQVGLDYGIIPLVLFIVYMVYQLINGRQPVWRKEVLAVILGASLVDFHMQYLLIDFIVVLCLDLRTDPIRQKRAEQLENRFFYVAVMLGLLYCLIPYYAISQGRYQTVLQFMPNNTDALCMVMMNDADKNTACDCADRILEHNRYISGAYQVKAYAAAMDGDLEAVLDNYAKVLELEKYDIEKYQAYDSLLEQLEDQFQNTGDRQMTNQLQEKRQEIRVQLEDVCRQSNPIAYKLRDIPRHTW